jgi:hypothetical protein
MTRGKDNMRIFHQMRHFSKVLVILRAEVGMLAVYKASCKTSGNLMG